MKKNNQAKKIALCAFLCALGFVILLFGGLFSFAFLFLAPAMAMAFLIPAAREFGAGTGVVQYAATALLAVLLVPDKEVALLYVFIGYYPLIKTYIDRLRLRIVRIVLKFLLFDGAIGLMYAAAIFVFGMQELVEEYRSASSFLLIALCILGNITFFLYDAVLARFRVLYEQRIRRRFFKE